MNEKRSKEGARNISEVYSAEDDAIIYDLKRAFKASRRGGWATGRLTRRK